jgi:hypothetical protein
MGSVGRHVLHHAHCSVLFVGHVASEPIAAETANSGLEAYRDDPAYTAPEMAYRVAPTGAAGGPAVLASGLSLGIAGGALAGEVLVEDIEAAAKSVAGTGDRVAQPAVSR